LSYGRRKTPEWVGDTPDTKVPDHVWKRVLLRYEWRCAICKRDYTLVKKFQKDHTVALINWAGREPHGNREDNIQPLCAQCHAIKTPQDVAEKARTAKRIEMRPGYVREKKPSRYKETKERLGIKFNWRTGRWEPKP
jgi:5-methylcytosine-specific restriction endonuclease McrA